MSRLSGYVLDTYDDVDGRVLRSMIPSPSDLPDLVKTASRLSEGQIGVLPDDRFALVLMDEGRKMKKYATVDKGNTVLSVMYLLKQAHLLPPEAVKVAATNLAAACQNHGLKIASALLKLAQLTMPGKKQSGSPVENPKWGHQNAALDDVDQRTNFNSIPGTNFMELPVWEGKETVKTAVSNQWISGRVRAGLQALPSRTESTQRANAFIGNLRSGAKKLIDKDPKVDGFPSAGTVKSLQKRIHATDVADNFHRTKIAGVVENVLGHSAPDGHEVRQRQRIWRESPYVDISSWTPKETTVEGPTPWQNEPTGGLLGNRYPTDGYDQIKTASVYFKDNSKQFHPRERHEYCVKLAARMTQVGIPVPEDVARYGSEKYAADVEAMVSFRKNYLQEELHPLVDLLLEKRAQVSPGAFADALEELDHSTRLKWRWGSEIPDPGYPTFRTSLDKLAIDGWTYSEGGAHIREDDLENLAINGYSLVVKGFGETFASGFRKSPKSVFESLPKPNKIVLARMAMDSTSNTGTE